MEQYGAFGNEDFQEEAPQREAIGYAPDNYDDHREFTNEILVLTEDVVQWQYGIELRNVERRWSLYDHVTTPFNFDEILFERLRLTGFETIVDVGCGNATLLRSLRNHHFHQGNMIGLEPFPRTLKHARLLAKLDDQEAEPGRKNPNEINFMLGKAEQLPLADHSVDVMLAMFMLYHTDPPEKALQEFKRVLKPGGKLVVATSGPKNKVRQRQIEADIAKRLDIKPPPIFSKPFDSEIAEERLRGWFKIIHHYQQFGRIRIDSEEKYQDYAAGIESMSSAFSPPLSRKQWLEVLEHVVIPAINDDLNKQPLAIRTRDANGELTGKVEAVRFFEDYVQRDYYICTPNPW